MTRLLTLLLAAALVAAACSGGADQSDPLLRGREIYGDVCSTCHGSSGGGGVGPSLATVTATWPSCADQIRWVSIGSDGWRSQVGETYGATAKPLQGGMPAHADRFTPDEIAAVAAFERITYGGADRAETLAGCGLAG